MPILRNGIASMRSGGPRQYTEVEDKILLTVKDEDSKDELRSELDKFSMTGRELDNAPVVIAEPRNTIDETVGQFLRYEYSNSAIVEALDDVQHDTDIQDSATSVMQTMRRLVSAFNVFPMVSIADFSHTFADFGPENLRVSPFEAETLDQESFDSVSQTMSDLNENANMEEAWSKTRGENSIIAVFDTAFSEDMFPSSRILDTYHSDEVESAFRSVEGHGTMCAGAAAASKDDGLPYNGTAPEADVLLLRITDSQGQIREDYIAEAWDWLLNKDYNRPVVCNHSYGQPICTGRPRNKYCQSSSADVVRTANSHRNIISVYAAGNEAMRCGHRPSGITNAITGTNSLADVITVGALRFDEIDAQRYSSHGRGDCAPIADPKPNVSHPLPRYVYYGGENGWEIKDMGNSVGGSAGGTSHASPTVSGLIALIQSHSMNKNGRPLQTEEVKQIIHENANPPRRTQINMFDAFIGESGYDARFGHGIIDINSALEDV